MITIFTTTKAFQGHSAIIQSNAIHSWKFLQPPCEIIIFGDDEGVTEAAAKFQVKHIPEVACNEFGTPLVSDMFSQAHQLARHHLLCYVNADIVLMTDFIESVQRVAALRQPFLMVGQRWNVDLENPINFDLDWQSQLRNYVHTHGQLQKVTGIDYFVFPKDLTINMPSFAIGRPGWDNWFIYEARSQNIAVIDATRTVMAVHQNHNYQHLKVDDAVEGWRKGPEADHNLKLAPSYSYKFDILDATHWLTDNGLKKIWRGRQVRQYLNIKIASNCWLRYPFSLLLKIIDLTYPLRTRLGLSTIFGQTIER
jgi:hypothetical protein